MRPPSVGALMLGLVPFVGICFTVRFWDRLEPRVLGIPFNLAWLIAWMVLCTLCLWAAYRMENARESGGHGTR
ncbi:MAG: DUF3311 domain-containing protein [Gammaproteobacteria bacterium]|nr:DUF3311 domain-containing protein [Gammaproteobacteria bacterium]